MEGVAEKCVREKVTCDLIEVLQVLARITGVFIGTTTFLYRIIGRNYEM